MIPTPDLRQEVYFEILTEINTEEAFLKGRIIDLEFPPEGVVSIEWADAVTSLRTDFSDLIEQWQQIEPPLGFDEHHVLYLSSLEAGLEVADAMFAWIGVGPNRGARQQRIEEYEVALTEMDRKSQQANAALDEGLATNETLPENVTLHFDAVSTSELLISEIVSRVTDNNDARWQFAWRTTAHNVTPETLEIAFLIKWLDADGFIVDSASIFNMRLLPGESRIISGAEQINLPAALNVDGLELEILQVDTISPE